MNQVIETIKKRRSTRLYEPKPIPRNIIKTVIEAGNAAPFVSEKRFQPWRFVVVDIENRNFEIQPADDRHRPVAGGADQVVALPVGNGRQVFGTEFELRTVGQFRFQVAAEEHCEIIFDVTAEVTLVNVSRTGAAGNGEFFTLDESVADPDNRIGAQA